MLKPTIYTFWTDHSCIFTMMTVMNTNPTVTAIIKVCLIPYAVHIIQENAPSSRSKYAIVVCTSDCYCICKSCNKNETN